MAGLGRRSQGATAAESLSFSLGVCIVISCLIFQDSPMKESMIPGKVGKSTIRAVGLCRRLTE